MLFNKTPKQPTEDSSWQGKAVNSFAGLSEGLALGLITAFVIGLIIYNIF